MSCRQEQYRYSRSCTVGVLYVRYTTVKSDYSILKTPTLPCRLSPNPVSLFFLFFLAWVDLACCCLSSLLQYYLLLTHLTSDLTSRSLTELSLTLSLFPAKTFVRQLGLSQLSHSLKQPSPSPAISTPSNHSSGQTRIPLLRQTNRQTTPSLRDELPSSTASASDPAYIYRQIRHPLTSGLHRPSESPLVPPVPPRSSSGTNLPLAQRKHNPT